MYKFLFLIVTFLLSTALATVHMKPLTTVASEHVRLGDLFENLDDKADIIVSSAPEPGRKMTFDSNQLRLLSLKHGLRWKPQSSDLYVTIERASRSYTDEDLLTRIEENILPKLSKEYNHLLVLDRHHPEVTVPLEFQGKLSLHEVKIRGNRFQAHFQPEGQHSVIVAGSINSIIEVPVLTRMVGPGDVIEEKDIEMHEFAANQIKGKPILQKEFLLGSTARNRPLMPGQMIKTTDIEKPTLVKRGDVIEMVYQSESLLITGRGQALQNGGLGDSIRVMNTNSRKIINGLITGEGSVEMGITNS